MTNRTIVSAIGTAALLATLATPAFATEKDPVVTQNADVDQTQTHNGDIASINNSATLRGSVLRAAKGNLGVNNASGIGNLQSNLLILHGDSEATMGERGLSASQNMGSKSMHPSQSSTLSVDQVISRDGDILVQGPKLTITTGSTTTSVDNSKGSNFMTSTKTQDYSESFGAGSALNVDVNGSASYSYSNQSSKLSGSSTCSGSAACTTGQAGIGGNIVGSGANVNGDKDFGTAAGLNFGGTLVTKSRGNSTVTASNNANQGSGTATVDVDLSAKETASGYKYDKYGLTTTDTSRFDNEKMSVKGSTTVTRSDYVGDGGPTARIDGDFARDASGNIGVNNVAGAFNDQSNAALISKPDTLAKSSANVNIRQSVKNVGNILVVNSTADLSGDAFRGASGNIGINNAAGALNQQSNALVIH